MNRRFSLALGLALATLTAAAAAPTNAEDPPPPEGAVPLLASQLLSIYGDHTWRWGDTGAAYFDTNARRLIAYSDAGGTTAQGKWRITDSGRLCLEADWVNASGRYPAVTCFAHVALNGDIYQRALPDGQWYVFRHAATEPTDEFLNLVPQDLVSTTLATSQ